VANSENVPSVLNKMTIRRSRITSATESKSRRCRGLLRDVSGIRHFVLLRNPSMTILTSGCEVQAAAEDTAFTRFTTMLNARSI
jgi:hypothetical protein